jgi:hypothetical protein
MSRNNRSTLTPEQLLAQLRALHEQIPDFAIVPDAELRKIRRAGYDLDVDIAREAAGMIAVSPFLQKTAGITPETLLQAEDEAARWDTVESEFRAVLRGLTTANAIRRRRIAENVRRVCEIGRTLIEKEEHFDLVPRVETVQRILKRKRRPKAAAPRSRRRATPRT